MEQQNSFSWIALVGVLVVALIVIAGFFYLKDTLPAPESMQETNAVESIETQSDSTEPTAIESDLNAQTPDEFDAEFDEAFAELDAELE